MLLYDSRTGRYLSSADAPGSQLPPVQAFGGATPADMQRFYDEVAFYTGQPAARQAPLPVAPQPTQPLFGVEAPRTALDQPTVLDVRRQPAAPMQQPVSVPTGQPQIMTRTAVEPTPEEQQVQAPAGPSTEEVLTDFGQDVLIDAAQDQIQSELGIPTTSEMVMDLGDYIYGTGNGALAPDISMATPETQAAWNKQPSGLEGAGMGTGQMVAEGAGWAVTAYNVSDAVNNIAKGSRRGKGAVEGFFTTSGAVIGGVAGATVGMPGVGAAIGSIIGRTVGRGMASIGERLGYIGGRTTKQYQLDRWLVAMERAASQEEQKFIARRMTETAERPKNAPLPVHDDGALKGRKWNLEELVQGGRPEDIWGEYAFFEAFPDWLTGWTEEERRIIAQAAMDENLLTTDKGSILFSGKRGHLARIHEIGYLVKQGQYQPVKTPEQRQQDRLNYLNSLGYGYDAETLQQLDREQDVSRVRISSQQQQAERGAMTAQEAEARGFQPISGRALWKPASERDGNLVVLMPYPVGELTIRDGNTGQVIAVGRSSGPSNGFADTIRFDRPGAAFQNVIIEDKYGNSIPVADGSQRLEGISVSGYGNPNQMGGFLPSFTPPPVTPLPPVKPLKKIKYKKRELPKVTYKAPKAPAQPKAPKIPAGVEKSKEK